MYEESKGQIVANYSRFLSSYFISTMYFSVKNCSGINYCVPLFICLRGERTEKFTINIRTQACQRKKECDIDFNDEDPFWNDVN